MSRASMMRGALPMLMTVALTLSVSESRAQEAELRAPGAAPRRAAGTREERGARLLKRFPQADKDGDGRLSMDEFRGFQAKRRGGRNEDGGGAHYRNLPDHLVLETDLSYGADSGQERWRLDLLYHRNTGDRRPAIVVIHGGGWRNGSKDKAGFQEMVRFFAERGYVAASINYRLTDQAIFPAQIEDCKAAVRWLRANATRYGVNPDRIGAIGSSAGGHLSGLLAVTTEADGLEGDGPNREQSSRLQAAVPLCGVFDLTGERVQGGRPRPGDPRALLLGGSPAERLELARRASPIFHVDANDPPILLVHAIGDRTVSVEQSKAMAKALEAAGVECELRLLESAKHGVGVWKGGEGAQEAIAAFFDRHLQPPVTAESRESAPGSGDL